MTTLSAGDVLHVQGGDARPYYQVDCLVDRCRWIGELLRCGVRGQTQRIDAGLRRPADPEQLAVLDSAIRAAASGRGMRGSVSQ